MTSGAHTGYLVRYLKQFGYIKQRNIHNGKVHRHKKSLFISKSYSVTISGVLDYILKNAMYKLFPQKKKRGGQRRKIEKEEADEKAVEEERRKKRKEERRGRKEEEEDKEKNRECDAKDAPPPPNAFPSQKLGNKMTPIKGRLGKNTTPTHGDPEKLVKRRQRSPSKGSRTSSIHPMQTPSTHCEKQNL